jgi:hypothetical protein
MGMCMRAGGLPIDEILPEMTGHSELMHLSVRAYHKVGTAFRSVPCADGKFQTGNALLDGNRWIAKAVYDLEWTQTLRQH